MLPKNTLTLCITIICAIFSIPKDSSAQVVEGNYKKADSLLVEYEKVQAYDRGIAFSKKVCKWSTAQDSVYAEYSEWIAYFWELKGNYKEAKSYYERSLRVFASSKGKESFRYAQCTEFYAALQLKMGHTAKGLTLLDQVLKIYTNRLGLYSIRNARPLQIQGQIYIQLGAYEKALPLFLRVKTINEANELPSNSAPLFNNLGMVYQGMHDFNQALFYFKESLKKYEALYGRDSYQNIDILNNLALLYKVMGNYQQALPLLIQCKAICEHHFGTDHMNFADALNNLAYLYQGTKEKQKALKLMLRATAIYKKNLGSNHIQYADALNNLAVLYQEIAAYKQAESVYQIALKILIKQLGYNHVAVSNTLNNISFLYKIMGNYTQAIQVALQCAQIQDKILSPNNPEKAALYNNIAMLYQKVNKPAKTWEYINKSSQCLVKEAFYPNIDSSLLQRISTTDFSSFKHVEELLFMLEISCLTLNEANFIKTNRKQQHEIGLVAHRLLAKARIELRDEKDKLRLLRTNKRWLQLGLSIPQSPSTAFSLADQNKSVLLLQSSKNTAAYKKGTLPDSIIQQSKQLDKQKDALKASLVNLQDKTKRSQLLNRIIITNQALEKLNKNIQQNFPEYYALKQTTSTIQPSVIQAQLDAETALIEYVVGDSILHIFYIDKQRVLWKKQPIEKAALLYKVDVLHQSLSNYSLLLNNQALAYKKYTEHAHWFYSFLLAPLLEGKPTITKLVIIPDNKLGNLPFETFLTKAAPKVPSSYKELDYVLNKYTISYNYSAALWKENNDNTPRLHNNQLFGIAANYDSTTYSIRLKKKTPTAYKLQPLPAARQEVATLQQKFEGLFAFDEMATEALVKAKAKDYAVLHFATHGLLNSNQPFLSALALTPDSTSEETSFLQAHEISKMQLNAALVVLSACETGFGKFEQGNGIASLARSFMYAGAPALIVSLWQVNDYATALIMQKLYANLANNSPKNQALRQAKIDYIAQADAITAHPAFWSSFIQIGNSGPVQIKQKSFSVFSFIAIGLVVLFILIFLFRRRK